MIFFASSVFMFMLLDNVKYYQLPYIRHWFWDQRGTGKKFINKKNG
jgi:hypothetical protein